MLSSVVLGSKLPAAVYGRHAAINGTGNMCYGAACYQAAFFVNAALLGVAAILSAILICHSRRGRPRPGAHESLLRNGS